MKRLTHSVLKYFLIYLAGLVLTSVALCTLFSYYAVEHFYRNPNAQQLAGIGLEYREELSHFDELLKSLPLQDSPEICSIICSDSNFDKRRSLDEKTPYLISYYKENGPHALKDPEFQIKLREIEILSEMFPTSFRDVLNDSSQHKEAPGFSDKFFLALKFEFVSAMELMKMGKNWGNLQSKADKLKTLQNLSRSCQHGTLSRKQAIEVCQSEIIN